MIDFEHVTKIYKRSDTPALEDIDFHVDDGEFEDAVGPRVEAGRLEVENGQGPVQCNEAHSILFPRGGCTNA